MSEFPFSDHDLDADYAEARRQLGQAMLNERIVQYGNSPRILALDELLQDVLSCQRIQDVIDHVGWPSASDQIIEGVAHFETSEDFIDGLRPVDEDGPYNIGAARFLHFTMYPPIDHQIESASMLSLYGMMPVKHRAHALAPELFDNLQLVMSKLFNRFSVYSDTDPLYDELMEPGNQYVRDALHLAYKIMGRLIKLDDNQWMNKAFGRNEDRPPILNADTYLRYTDHEG